MDDVPLICLKLLAIFLSKKDVRQWKLIYSCRCLSFLSHYQWRSLLIHIFLIWCKINKFISYFSKNEWKSFIKSINKPVEIHWHSMRLFILLLYQQGYTHGYQQIIVSFLAFRSIYRNFAVAMMRKLRTIEMKRLSIEQFHDAEKMPLVVVLDDVRSMHNVGSVLRTADAFRVEAVYLCGITGRPPHPDIHKTALGAEDSVSWQYFDNVLDAVNELKGRGVKVFSVEQAEGSTMLPHFHATAGEKYAVVLGNEVKGVHQEVIDESDGCLEIPQLGTKHSMNVSVTAGIIIYKFAEELIL